MKRCIGIFLIFCFALVGFPSLGYAEEAVIQEVSEESTDGDFLDASEEEREAYQEVSEYLEQNHYEEVSLETFLECYEDSGYSSVQEYALSIERTIDGENELYSSSPSSSADYWFYNTGTTLPQEPDYSKYNLLKVVKKGDIVFDAKGGLGVTGHIAIVEGLYYSSTYSTYYIRVIEAIEDGVCRGVLDDYRVDERASSVYRVSGATSTDVNNAVSFCVGQLGKDYGDLTNKSYSSTTEKWYCSELVWAAYYNQGIDIETTGILDEPRITPRDIIRSDITEELWVVSFAQPKLTSATPNDSCGVNLKWNSVSGATEYYIYQCDTQHGIYKKVATTTNTTYSRNGLSPNTTYYFRVAAHKPGGESNDSLPIKATVKMVPPTIYASSAKSTTSISITWSKSSGATSYEVYRATSASGTYTKIASVTADSFTDTGLKPGTTYYYKIRVYGYSEENVRNSSALGAYKAVTTKK